MLFTKLIGFIFSVVLFCFITMAPADYIEGIDTTDVNGYGLDSAFQVRPNGFISAPFVAQYQFFEDGAKGYFNYSFEDIKIAPDIIRPSYVNWGQFYYCFIQKNTKDSTYCKVQIMQKLSDGRYVFKYGKNTIPNNRILFISDYDRTIRYKPNNLYNCVWGYPMIGITDTTYLDPPLPNDNHLLGYIFYRSKFGVSIDTTAPINMTQWDSIAFTTTNKLENPDLSNSYFSGCYFNIVAVYSEGRSDFLNGWTKNRYSAVKVNKEFIVPEVKNNFIQIQKVLDGLIFKFPLFTGYKRTVSFSIYNIIGRQMARFSDITGDHIVWYAPEGIFNAGVYIAKAQLSDKSTVSRTFMITR